MTDVLVVDDDFMVRSIHEAYVSELPDHRVVGMAANGREALDLIEKLSPDLVLLDVHLPDMTGIDVLYELRRRRNFVGVMIVTAERHVDFVRSALRGGASQYLVKPFSAAELHSRLIAFEKSTDRLQGPLPGQAAIDEAFRTAEAGTSKDDKTLPKGLSPESCELVRSALLEHGEMSASDCADHTGMARVSARRYLEYLVQAGEAHMRLQYGGGRPVKLFRPAGGG